MVDDIHITGSDVEWALEKTQSQILAALSKTQKISEKQEKHFKDATSGGKIFDKKAFKEFTSGLKTSTDQAVKHAKGQKTLIGTTQDLNKEFKESSKTFKTAMVGMGLVGGILGQLYGQFTNTIKVFSELNDVGISNSMSYKGLSKSLAQIGMSLDEFQAISQRYTTVIGKMGFARFSDLVTGIGEGFHKFGLTMSEGAEWAGEFIEQQRIMGNYSIYSQRGLNEAIRSNIDRLTAYSKTLNVSRSELQSAQTEAAGDAMAQAKLMGMGADEADAARKAWMETVAAFRSFDVPEMGQFITDMFGYSDPSRSPAYLRLVETGGSNAANIMADIARGLEEGVAPTEKVFADLGTAMETFVKGPGYDILQSQNGNSEIESMVRFARNWRHAIENATPGGEDTAAQEMVRLTAELNTNLGRLSGSFLYLANSVLERFIGLLDPDGTTEGTVGKGVKSLASAAGSAADWLMTLAEGKWDWKKALGTVGDALWSGIKTGFEASMHFIATLITGAIEDLIYAIENFSIFGGEDSGPPLLGAERRQYLQKGADTAKYQNKMRDAVASRNNAVSQLASYNTNGVSGSNDAYMPGGSGYEAVIAPLLRTIQEQNAIAIQSKRELEKLNALTDEGNG